MASVQTVWGIDVGRCALKAIKLRLAEDKCEIVACEHIEHAKILTQPDADRAELIRSALEKLLAQHDLSKDNVVVSVPGQHTLARFTKLPPVAPKRIPDIVKYEADQQIPFDMDEVIWDYQTFQQEGAPDLEVGIFAMKRELLREHLLHFEQVAIEPIAVQAGPLAVYNGAHFDGLLGDETTILLDIGAENTDLIIATKETFWTRTVAIGGNKFSEALVKSFKLSFAKAESLKRTAESSKYARQIFQAMRPVFADLVQELQRSIGFYSSTHRDTHVEKVICFGNAFKLPGLQKYLQQNLGLPVEKPEVFRKAAVSGAGNAVKEEFLSMACAYGLAAQGLDLGKVTSNLLPTEIAKQVVWRKKKPAFAAAAACLLLAGGTVWFRQVADMRALRTGAAASAPTPRSIEEAWQLIQDGPSPSLPQRAQAAAVLSAGDLLKKELGKLSGQGEQERTEAEKLVELQANKQVIPKIVDLIHNAVPPLPQPLAEAKSQEDILAAIRSGALPARGDREMVILQTLYMHYEPNVNSYVWRSELPAPEPLHDPEADLSAVKLELTVRTPYQGGTGKPYTTTAEFIADSFIKRLREMGRRPNTGYHVDRVYLYAGYKVEVPAAGPGAGPAAGLPGAGGGRGGRFAPAPAGGVAPPAAASRNLDPVTNEPMSDDWEFVIWADVVLEDAPASEPGDTEGSETEEG